MESLEKLKKSIAEFKKSKLREEEEDKKKKRKAARRETAFWRKEKKRLETKLKLSEDIFSWAREFSTSEVFNDLVRLSEKYHLSRIARSDRVEIHGGGWGHMKNGDGFGCNSTISVDRRGILHYTPTYKGMESMEALTFENPRDLAERLTAEYIEGLHRRIQIGQVYERLAEAMKDRA